MSLIRYIVTAFKNSSKNFTFFYSGGVGGGGGDRSVTASKLLYMYVYISNFGIIFAKRCCIRLAWGEGWEYEQMYIG